MKKKTGHSAEYQKKKSSYDGSGNYSNLKRQVEKVNERVSTIVTQMANDPNVSFVTFGRNYNKVKRALEIMDKAIGLGEEMKKLKAE